MLARYQIRLTENMGMAEIHKKLQELGSGSTPPHQHYTVEHGTDVVYMRAATMSDKVKRQFMNADMRAAETNPAINLIMNACAKENIDPNNAHLKNIKEALSHGGDLQESLSALRITQIRNDLTD
jgi:hypothetical protein